MTQKLYIYTETKLAERDRLIKESCVTAFLECKANDYISDAILSAPSPEAKFIELPDIDKGIQQLISAERLIAPLIENLIRKDYINSTHCAELLADGLRSGLSLISDFEHSIKAQAEGK